MVRDADGAKGLEPANADPTKGRRFWRFAFRVIVRIANPYRHHSWYYKRW